MLGKRSWESRKKRYGVKKLKQKLSEAGKAAKHSGRPRLPDDKGEAFHSVSKTAPGKTEGSRNSKREERKMTRAVKKKRGIF